MPLQALNRNEDMKVSSEEIAYTASAEAVRRGEIKAVGGNRRAKEEKEAARGIQLIVRYIFIKFLTLTPQLIASNTLTFTEGPLNSPQTQVLAQRGNIYDTRGVTLPSEVESVSDELFVEEVR